jgi:hypothetical protein
MTKEKMKSRLRLRHPPLNPQQVMDFNKGLGAGNKGFFPATAAGFAGYATSYALGKIFK